MNPDNVANQKRSVWSRIRNKISGKLNRFKSSPKGLIKCLLVLFLIQYVFTFCMDNMFFVSPKVSVFLGLVLVGIFPFAHLSYLAVVFVLYWLIDLVTSKVKMPALIKLVVNIALLVVFSTALYTISITSQNVSYYTSGSIFKLIFFEIYLNYRNLLHLFETTGLGNGPYFDISYFIGTLWPIATILIPIYYCVKKYIFGKKVVDQAKLDQDILELEASQLKLDKKYIKKHGVLKPNFTWHRYNLKVFVGIGYLSLYLSAFLFTFLQTVIDWIFGVKFIIGDLIEMILMIIVGVCLGLLGMWILQRKKKLLDDHYRISAYKINWRINITISIVLVMAILGTLFPNEPKILGPEDYSFVAGTVILTIVSFVNSLRLRRKYKNTLKSIFVTTPKSIENNDNCPETTGS